MTQAIYVDTGKGLFADIFDRYRENGLEEAIQSSIHQRMQYSLEAALGDRMISFKMEYGGHRDTDMHTILDSGGQSINFNSLQIDLKKGATPTPLDLVFDQGLEYGRLNWRGARETLVLQPKYRDMATRDRYFFRHFGLIVDAQLFGWDQRDVTQCTCPLHLIQPVKRGMHSRPFMLWQCVFCGQPYVCSCARGVPEIFQSTGRSTFPDDMAAFDKARYRDGVCHLCRGISSTLVYRSRMYGSEILSRYEPYIHEHMHLHGVDQREAENMVRDRLGVPRIGEGWLAQAALTRLIETLFPEERIEREASPSWLGNQRFDIYLPDRGVAVEYQGEQHEIAVERFGGAEGLRQTQERDRIKRHKAADNGIEIVEFKYSENVTENLVRQRIKTAFERAHTKA